MERRGGRSLPGDDEAAHRTAECSSMRAAGPATRPPHAFFELGAHPFDMLPPCLGFFDGDSPADPLVAREGRDVFPSRQRPRVGRQRLTKIGGQVMDDSTGDSSSCHGVFSQAKGSKNLIREYNSSFAAIAGEDAENAGGGIRNRRLILTGTHLCMLMATHPVKRSGTKWTGIGSKTR